jgi:DNA processing protein
VSGTTGELPYWLALRRAGLGSTNFALLLAHFGSVGVAWSAPLEELTRAGIDRQYVRAVNKARTSFDGEREMALVEKHGLRVYTWLDADYPASLREIEQAPPVLFVSGEVGPELDPAVAVVGTRHVTPYGRQATEAFAGALARAGVAIISGLARGVDAIAHRAALEGGAPTVAVLAGGIDTVYPRENEGLAARIREHGCLVSEYPPGIPPRPDYFPRRNRILSGLAKATLVVEAGQGSGALHTANWAFSQGRDVFAVPGSIFSKQSEGTNQLIRENTARLVTTPEQLCEELNLLSVARPLRLMEQPPEEAPTRAPATTPAAEDGILRWLGEGPRHIDDIARAEGKPVHEVSGALQLLVLEGLVSETGPMMFTRI